MFVGRNQSDYKLGVIATNLNTEVHTMFPFWLTTKKPDPEQPSNYFI